MFLGFIGAIVSFISSNAFFYACYIGNNGTFPKPLSAEEEQFYLEKMVQGNTEAKNILIEHNLRLVAHIAKKYNSINSRDSDDLLSIGTIGLIKGISNYNLDKKTKLSTYIAKCIENEILMYLRSQKKLQHEVSLNDVVGNDSEGNEITLFDILSDDDESVINEVSLKMQVRNLYSKMKQVLQKREEQILCWRYGLGSQPEKTQNEIADILGISRSYVSRIEKKALDKLQNCMHNEDT